MRNTQHIILENFESTENGGIIKKSGIAEIDGLPLSLLPAVIPVCKTIEGPVMDMVSDSTYIKGKYMVSVDIGVGAFVGNSVEYEFDYFSEVEIILCDHKNIGMVVDVDYCNNPTILKELMDLIVETDEFQDFLYINFHKE